MLCLVDPKRSGPPTSVPTSQRKVESDSVCLMTPAASAFPDFQTAAFLDIVQFHGPAGALRPLNVAKMPIIATLGQAVYQCMGDNFFS